MQDLFIYLFISLFGAVEIKLPSVCLLHFFSFSITGTKKQQQKKKTGSHVQKQTFAHSEMSFNCNFLI